MRDHSIRSLGGIRIWQSPSYVLELYKVPDAQRNPSNTLTRLRFASVIGAYGRFGAFPRAIFRKPHIPISWLILVTLHCVIYHMRPLYSFFGAFSGPPNLSPGNPDSRRWGRRPGRVRFISGPIYYRGAFFPRIGVIARPAAIFLRILLVGKRNSGSDVHPIFGVNAHLASFLNTIIVYRTDVAAQTMVSRFQFRISLAAEPATEISDPPLLAPNAR